MVVFSHQAVDVETERHSVTVREGPRISMECRLYCLSLRSRIYLSITMDIRECRVDNTTTMLAET